MGHRFFPVIFADLGEEEKENEHVVNGEHSRLIRFLILILEQDP
jgi:hypothetical protein